MEHGPDNQKIYDANWDSWLDMKRFGPASRWLRALIGDACRDVEHAPQDILDVGCGEGTNTTMLAVRYPEARVCGSDFSLTGIRAARRHSVRSNLTFMHDPDNRALDQPVDMVCCFEVLEHVEDWRPFLTRLATSSRRYLLLSFPTGRMRPFEANVGHLRNFAQGEVEGMLDAIGFKPVRISYAGFPFYSPLYRELCQITNAGDDRLTRGRYGSVRRMIAAAIYLLFRYASSQRRGGDQFVGLFVRAKSA